MLNFVRGQKIKLSDITKANLIQVGIFVNAPVSVTLDISCFGIDTQNKLSDDRYFIFYNQKSSPCGSIKSLGAVAGDNEQIQIDLSKLPSFINKLVFVITIDGNGVMSQINNGYLRLIEKSNEVMRFSFLGTDFQNEKAIIVGEIYLKDVWRFSAVGQGFNGGLSALLKHFGGEEITTPSHQPQSIKTTSTMPSSKPSTEDIKINKKVSLEKRLEKEAPHLVSLAKILTVSLEKKKLLDTTAKVALVLDASGSMSTQYSRGDLQLVLDKIVPLSVHFDDDGELETWAFAEKKKKLTSVTTKNVKKYVNKEWGGWGQWMRKLNASYNNEPVVMKEIVETYKNSKLPSYVIFISDGGVGYDNEIERIIVESSKYPIFWQFVGLGGSNYGILERFDTMKGRLVDNCNFFALDNIHSISNTELYEKLLNEFPDWLQNAQNKKII
ncbi:MAG: VWA domain-containing protein [Desulfobacterales bacterium]|nr:VWA domain-containing protein [Desulfobacterales bacterium]